MSWLSKIGDIASVAFPAVGLTRLAARGGKALAGGLQSPSGVSDIASVAFPAFGLTRLAARGFMELGGGGQMGPGGGSSDPYRTRPEAFAPYAGQDDLRQRAEGLYDPRANVAQDDLGRVMKRRAFGEESAVREMLRQEGETAAARAIANSQARGGSYNPGMAAMLGEQAAADIRANANQQGSIAALQEQQQAQNAYADLLGQTRGQTLQERMAALGSLQQLGESNRAAAIERERIESGAFGQSQSIAAQQAAAQQDLWAKIFGGAITGTSTGVINTLLPSTAAASDKRLKEDVTDESKEIDSFLGNIKPNGYRYKDKKFGADWYVSPMAQELEKSKIGKSMVIDTPEGKMVDYGRGLGAMLAASARLSKRLDKLEGVKARAA